MEPMAGERIAMRALLAAAAATFLCAVAAAPASAEVCPPYEGIQFPEIHSAAEPEDYCWEVQLEEEQELRQIDEQHVGVYYSEEHLAFTIVAQPAHDVEGASVPTSIAVTGESDFTVTVHHREGNPAAGGAPFDYPISPGVGWEGGFQTTIVTMPPGESPPPAPTTPACKVPNLVGSTLPASRRKLKRAHCKLGPVHGQRSKVARVVKQFRRPGTSLPAGTAVGVKLSA